MADPKTSSAEPPPAPKGFRKQVKRLQNVLKAIHNFGASFDKHVAFAQGFTDRYLAEAFVQLDIPQNSDIMDYGCRGGTFTHANLLPLAQEKNLHIFAVEKCAAHYQHAITNHAHDRITYVNEDILSENFSLKSKKFPTVISIYYLHTAENYRADLEKLYAILENGGKCCIFMGSIVDDFFQFAKYLQDTPNWKSLGDQLVIPDFILARWAGRDYAQVIKDALTSVGFQIKAFRLVTEYTVFPSKEECVDFLLAGYMAEIGECFPSSEMYKKLEAEYLKFLNERVTETCGSGCGPKGPRRHRLEFEIALIIVQK